MLGKLLGRLSVRGWRDGERSDLRWAKGRDERLWQRDAADEIYWGDLDDAHDFTCTCRFCRPNWD